MKRHIHTILAVAFVTFVLPALALAQETVRSDAIPTMPQTARWAGSVVVIILGMFLAAMVWGAIYDLLGLAPTPEPLPADDHHAGHGHDDHGHGHGHH